MNNSDTYVLSFWIARVLEQLSSVLTSIVSGLLSLASSDSDRFDSHSSTGVQGRDGRKTNPYGGRPKEATLSA